MRDEKNKDCKQGADEKVVTEMLIPDIFVDSKLEI